MEYSEQVKAIDLFVQHINATGGINGRTINPMISNFDPTNESEMRAQSTHRARDHLALKEYLPPGLSSSVCIPWSSRSQLRPAETAASNSSAQLARWSGSREPG